MTGSSISQPPVACATDLTVAGLECPAARTDDEIRFHDYRLLPSARRLLREGRVVELGSRAFDLLHVLARHCGSVVDKDEIVRQVWPTTHVEESNLRYQVAVLRRALGTDRDLVQTVPGRGYLLATNLSSLPCRDGIVSPDLVRDLDSSSILDQAAGAALRGLIRSVLEEFWQVMLRDPRFAPIQERLAG